MFGWMWQKSGLQIAKCMYTNEHSEEKSETVIGKTMPVNECQWFGIIRSMDRLGSKTESGRQFSLAFDSIDIETVWLHGDTTAKPKVPHEIQAFRGSTSTFI